MFPARRGQVSSAHFLPKRSLGERQLCCQSCRFQRQAIPSTERRKHHSYWAMAAALDLHREAALPVPLPGGLAALCTPLRISFRLCGFYQIPHWKFGQKISRHPIQYFKSLGCRLLYLFSQTDIVLLAMIRKNVAFLIYHNFKNSFYPFQSLQSNFFFLT